MYKGILMDSKKWLITSVRPRKWWLLLVHNCVWTLVLTLIIQLKFVQGSKDSSHVVKLIYGVNAGGDAHSDVYGVRYLRDPLMESTIGIASDYGNRLNVIRRTLPEDEILYRTERYSTETSFGYDIPILDDGEYVLVMKFAEVYFNRAGQKVFDIELNRKHIIVSDLDIFASAGHGTAHDEIIPFKVEDGGKTLVVNGESSAIKKKSIRLEFLKGPHDNPKINAFYVIQGSINDIPPLPTDKLPDEELDMEEFEEDDDDDEGDMILDGIPKTKQSNLNVGGQRRYKRSGISLEDPWNDESLINKFGPIAIIFTSSLVLLVITVKIFRGL